MKNVRFLFVVIWLLVCFKICQGQCSANITGVGTTCVGPVSVVPATGQSPTSAYQLTPATASNPCPAGVAQATGTYVECPQDGMLTIDYGDGNGFVPCCSPSSPQLKEPIVSSLLPEKQTWGYLLIGIGLFFYIRMKH